MQQVWVNIKADGTIDTYFGSEPDHDQWPKAIEVGVDDPRYAVYYNQLAAVFMAGSMPAPVTGS